MYSVSTRQHTRVGHVDFFVNATGRPIKFRIQPGFSSALRARLEDGITSHGGLVISKIPVRGLVVIDPKSRTGRELVREWAWEERPARRFVSYAFVLRCIDTNSLLSVDEHALRREDVVRSSGRSGKTQAELSSDAKDKLALYLATILPDTESGRRSSNKVYQRLVKNKHRYPWVGDHEWKAFRDQYCKNKKYYDKLISAINKEANHEAKEEALSISAPRRQFLITKKTNNNSAVPTIVEVVIPIRKKAAIENTKLVLGKKVKFKKTLEFERKRKFGDDLTNAEAKSKTQKRLRTIDDMLNAPLPPIVADRSARLSGKRSTTPTSQNTGILDVEVARAAQDKSQGDSFVHEGLGLNGKENASQTNLHSNASESLSLDRFQESLSFYGIDLDDLRSAAALDPMGNHSEDEFEDETSVAEILGLTTTASGRLIADPLAKEIVISTKASHQDSLSIAIEELAQNTHFTVKEIENKLTGFSGNLDKTRDFFVRCRKLVEDLFMGSAIAGSHSTVWGGNGTRL